MKTIKNFIKFLCLILLSVSFSQCATSMKLQKEAPTTFGEVYFQEWVAGVQGGGSGTNIFIEVKDENIVLESVYFRGKISNFENKPSKSKLFIGRFKSKTNTQQSIITSSSDEKVVDLDFPFKLKENECIISYKDDKNSDLKYYKITDVKEKPLEALPMSAPPNNN